MPSRILREAYVASDSVGSMPPDTQLRFPRYLLAVDDWGCALWAPTAMRGKLFPHLLPHVSTDDVEGDLLAMRAAGIIATWETDGRTWWGFPSWFRHQRRPRPGALRRTPEPPWELRVGGVPLPAVAPRPTTTAARAGHDPDAERRQRERDKKRRQRAAARAVDPWGEGGGDMSPLSPGQHAPTVRVLETIGGGTRGHVPEMSPGQRGDNGQSTQRLLSSAAPCPLGAPAGAGAGAGTAQQQHPSAAVASSLSPAGSADMSLPGLALVAAAATVKPPATPAGRALLAFYPALAVGPGGADAYCAALARLYPSADIVQGIERSSAYLAVTPQRKPRGVRGLGQFLKNWLRKDHNRLARDAAPPAPRAVERVYKAPLEET